MCERCKGSDSQMLTAQGDASRAMARDYNVIDKSREGGNAADEESDNGTPVASEFGRVAVYAVEVVHIRYRHIAAPDDVVAAARKMVSGRGDVAG